MGQLIFVIAMLVLSSGLYIMLTSSHYVRKVVGLSIFQSSVLVFYIALGKVKGGVAPIDACAQGVQHACIFSSPLPHVLMLTAIVVGFATMSVACALAMKIKSEYGSVCEEELILKYGEEDSL